MLISRMSNRSSLKIFCVLLSFSLTFIVIGPVQAISLSQNEAEVQARLTILKVKCTVQTNDGIFSGDEIALGGTVSSKYGVDIVDHRDLGNFTSGSETEVDWVLALVPVDKEEDFVRAQISLAELDFTGGRSEVLEEVAKKEYDYIVLALEREFLKLLDEVVSVSTYSPNTTKAVSFGAILGQSLKLVAGAVAQLLLEDWWDIIGEIIGEIIGDTEDDMFRPQTIEAPIAELWNTYGKDESSLTGTIILEDFEGEYEIEYSWQLVTNSVQGASYQSEYNPVYSLVWLVARLEELYDEVNNRMNDLYLPIFTTQ